MQLCSAMCGTCIFHDAQHRLPLRSGRLRELIADARRRESYIVCHATLAKGDVPAVCRGFYERFSTNAIRVFGRMGGIVEIDPPSTQESA